MNISVCIATYNGAKYIKAQLTSILNQLGKDDEVIVSDDSSTDNTIEIIRQFNDDRIKIYTGNQFRSPILNFEHAISKATGKYIFLSDQDDEWAPNKIATLLPLMDKKMMVASYFTFIDQHSNPIASDMRNPPSKSFLRNFIKPTIPGCCMGFTNELQKKILPFPKGIAMHDWWIALIAGINSQIVVTTEPLTRIRRHETNYSSTGSKSNFSLWQKIEMRYFILKKLLLYLRQSKQNQ